MLFPVTIATESILYNYSNRAKIEICNLNRMHISTLFDILYNWRLAGCNYITTVLPLNYDSVPTTARQMFIIKVYIFALLFKFFIRFPIVAPMIPFNNISMIINPPLIIMESVRLELTSCSTLYKTYNSYYIVLIIVCKSFFKNFLKMHLLSLKYLYTSFLYQNLIL